MKNTLLVLLTAFAFGLNAQQMVMEVGQVTINHTTTSIALSETFTDPVVIALPPEFNGNQEATVKVSQVTGTGFDIALEEPVNRDGWHLDETVHYVVVEKGSYTFADGTKLEAGTVVSSNLSFQTVNLLENYTVPPAIYTQVQATNSTVNFLHIRQNNANGTSFQVSL